MLGCLKYTHWLADYNKVTQEDFIVETCSHFENYFPLQPRADTTAQLYCTLSMYVRNTKNYFPPEPKN